MARKKPATILDSPPAGSEDDRIERLTSTVDTLAQELRVLREAIDELRELLDWTMRNREAPARDHPFPPFPPVTGISRDPVEMEHGGKIHPATLDQVPDEDEPNGATPGELF